MAEIRGFRGLRYAPERVGELGAVVCPPYDIISPAEAESLRAASPYNAVRLELPEAQPGDRDGQTRCLAGGRCAGSRGRAARLRVRGDV